MPQLDIFIFFSQYFILLFSFLFLYVFIVKFLVKETDFVEQMGKYKMASIFSTAAIIMMIFDKLNSKIVNFYFAGIQLYKNINRNVIFDLILNQIFYKNFFIFFLTNKKFTEIYSLKFKNYINK